MKSISFLLAFLLITCYSSAQNLPTNILNSVNVTPPAFTGIKGTMDVLEMPGTASINDYLTTNIQIPEKVRERGIEGTEIVQFTVMANGNLTDFNVINSISHIIDNIVIESLQSTDGMWKPGYNNNIPVDMTKEVAITFLADNSNHVKIAQHLFRKGGKKLKKNKTKRAVKLYDRAMIYQPYSEPLLFNRGISRYNLGDESGACKDWTRLKLLGSDLAIPYLNKFCSDDMTQKQIDIEFITYNIND
jgi:hypothetical protein